MADRDAVPAVARQEAVQPSLWDRLVDDLPGVVAEQDGLMEDLSRALGDAGRAEALVAGGPRAVERADDLDDEARPLAHRIVRLAARRRLLEEGGVFVTPDVLREAVRRDIEMLFNIERLECDPLLTDLEARRSGSAVAELADYPNVRRSVLNYGVPAFSGHAGSDFDRDALARELREVLAIYEPRLKRDTIRVKVEISPRTGMRIDIDGTLMLSPVPERLRLSTTIDLDSGAAATALEPV